MTTVLAILDRKSLDDLRRARAAVLHLRECLAPQAARPSAVQHPHARLLQSAEGDVAEARRRDYAVDPDNRLVKADLAARLEDAIGRLDDVRSRMAATATGRPVSLAASEATYNEAQYIRAMTIPSIVMPSSWKSVRLVTLYAKRLDTRCGHHRSSNRAPAPSSRPPRQPHCARNPAT
jgi:hypothetical protein